MPRRHPPFFRTVWVQNAKGSNRKGRRCNWSITVDATVFTVGNIDDERLQGLADVTAALSEWLVNEFGFYHASYDTEGVAVDQPVSAADLHGAGLWYVRLDVEDVTMARGDYRSRRDIKFINGKMLGESEQHRSYSVVGCTLKPRLAPDLRMHVSPSIRELIVAELKRYFARLVGR